jgi:hypothetical protein
MPSSLQHTHLNQSNWNIYTLYTRYFSKTVTANDITQKVSSAQSVKMVTSKTPSPQSLNRSKQSSAERDLFLPPYSVANTGISTFILIDDPQMTFHHTLFLGLFGQCFSVIGVIGIDWNVPLPRNRFP